MKIRIAISFDLGIGQEERSVTVAHSTTPLCEGPSPLNLTCDNCKPRSKALQILELCGLVMTILVVTPQPGEKQRPQIGMICSLTRHGLREMTDEL